ncbi:MAG: hypothetical protein NC401_18830 [Ruminococcus sp.]|nr:hypothetical protein [Ruminococcus sp.]
MSTKERLYTLIEELDERQMLEIIGFITSRKKKGRSAASVVGILSEYANPDLVPLEKGAWERAAIQKHENP